MNSCHVSSYSIKESEKAYNAACQIIPGGVNSPVRAFKQIGGHPIFFEKAAGCKVTDIEGNVYIDMCQSWGALILGHADPDVVEAVKRAAEDGLSFGACHKKEIEIAEMVLSAFYNFENVRLVNSGTEAVMTALRIARGYTKRDLVIKFDGGYHGHVDSMLVKAGSGLATFGVADSLGITKDTIMSTIVAHFDNEDEIENIFRKVGDRVAAVIIEPLPANCGLLIQRHEFLKFLRIITAQYGSLLIFDEVISGFRLHFGGYYALLGIVPDIITLGKIIGGGMPIGAVVGNRSVMKILAPQGDVYQAGTLSGNPVSLAAGIATLRKLENGAIYKRIDTLGKKFASLIENSTCNYCKVRRMGSVLWLYLDKEEFPKRPEQISSLASERFKRIYRGLLQDGVYLPPSSLEVFFVSDTHTEANIEKCVRAIIAQLTGNVSEGVL
jgi:glutamate-1-semialdehyde 2,1-aminomutase